jgi:hypothetical protein
MRPGSCLGLSSSSLELGEVDGASVFGEPSYMIDWKQLRALVYGVARHGLDPLNATSVAPRQPVHVTQALHVSRY